MWIGLLCWLCLALSVCILYSWWKARRVIVNPFAQPVDPVRAYSSLTPIDLDQSFTIDGISDFQEGDRIALGAQTSPTAPNGVYARKAGVWVPVPLDTQMTGTMLWVREGQTYGSETLVVERAVDGVFFVTLNEQVWGRLHSSVPSTGETRVLVHDPQQPRGVRWQNLLTSTIQVPHTWERALSIEPNTDWHEEWTVSVPLHQVLTCRVQLQSGDQYWYKTCRWLRMPKQLVLLDKQHLPIEENIIALRPNKAHTGITITIKNRSPLHLQGTFWRIETQPMSETF